MLTIFITKINQFVMLRQLVTGLIRMLKNKNLLCGKNVQFF